MFTPPMPQNVQFCMETMFAPKGNRVGIIKPDEGGFYNDLPMMVLGAVTENDSYYDVESMVDHLTNPKYSFRKKLYNQQLYGEWGHPDFLQYAEKDRLPRLLQVNEKYHSHLFREIKTANRLESGGILVVADLKPTGPYGQYLKESLDDPYMNTGFSLRSWINNTMKNGVKYRTVNSLVTVDTVGAGGYPDASKKNALGLESMAVDGLDQYHDVTIDVLRDGNLMCEEIALESLSGTELNEIFGVTTIKRLTQRKTLIKTDRRLASQFPSSYPTAVFNEHFRSKK